jgi:hypothetical protein
MRFWIALALVPLVWIATAFLVIGYAGWLALARALGVGPKLAKNRWR